MENKKAINLFENELNHVTDLINTDFSSISVKSISLARNLNRNIEKILKDKKISIGDLQRHPEIYNELLDSECQILIKALLNTKSSGVFMILDGTINPNLPYSNLSKAGLYIRNTEPNINSLESPYLYMLRGPIDIAKRNDIQIHPQWEMEFDTNIDTFFTKTVETSRNNVDLPLSKLYYWNPNNVSSSTAHKVMLCIVPLIAQDGTIYGVCGFEVSSLLFKLSYIPDITISDSIFTLLSKEEDKAFNLSFSFVSAKYPAFVINDPCDIMEFNQKKPKSLIKYSCFSGNFIGLHKKIELYAEDSLYKNENWVVCVMIPANDFERVIDNINQRVIILLLALLLTAIAASFWFSKLYFKPIIETISKMKQIKPSEIEKTNIVEIDDLLEFISRQDRNAVIEPQMNNTPVQDIQNISMFQEFLNNIKTLSPAERAVFDLYMEGYTGKEIAEKLYLSINTIKTHNKRIYEKMNVSSRNELMVYFKMMKEINSNKQDN